MSWTFSSLAFARTVSFCPSKKDTVHSEVVGSEGRTKRLAVLVRFVLLATYDICVTT